MLSYFKHSVTPQLGKFIMTSPPRQFPLNLPKPLSKLSKSLSDKSLPRDEDETPQNEGGFIHFSQLAQDLAALSPGETLKRLEEDPFGTRTFDTQLIEHETALGRILSIQEMQTLFPCPPNEERITLPDIRVESKAEEFRQQKKGTFLFFQHLRKAGGTNFCIVALNARKGQLQRRMIRCRASPSGPLRVCTSSRTR